MSNSLSFSNKKKVGAGSLALLVGAGTLFVAPTAFAAAGDPVSLDSGLQSCINSVLGNSADTVLTEGDLAGLTGTLNCSFVGSTSAAIESIDGLEFATGLTGLNIFGNDVEDLSPLTGLNLEYLNISANPGITSVAPLAGMTSLKEFAAAAIPDVSDWSSIAGLTGLTDLALGSSGLNDVSFISGLTNLDYLSLSNSPDLTDLSPLVGLTSLTWLAVEHTGVTDFDDIGQISSLEWVDADGLAISDFSGLTNLTNLEELVLADVTSDNLDQIGDISVPLGYLHLSGAGFTSLDWLAGMSIEALSVYDVPVSDLSVVTGVQDLRFLYYDASGVTDVSPLASMTGLETVSLNSNSIADISALDDLGLASLSVSNQTVRGTAVIDTLFANPIVALDGSVVSFPEAEYSATDEGFNFTSVGPYVGSWSVPTPSSGSLQRSFSGSLLIDVTDGSSVTPSAPLGLSVASNPASPTTAVNLSVTPVDEAESYTFTLTPTAGGAPVVHVFTPTTPGEFPSQGIVLGGLQSDTEYSVSVFYTTFDGVDSAVSPSASEAPMLYRTAYDDSGVGVEAPALTNLVATTDVAKPNTIDITFDSLESVGGTGGHGDAILYTVEYRIAGSETDWMVLTTAGDNTIGSLKMTNIYAGTYDIRVFYTTDTDAKSAVAEQSNVIVTGTPRPDGQDPNNPAPGTVDPSKNLNNSASNMNMSELGLLAGGGLMLAAAGALMLGGRRTRLEG